MKGISLSKFLPEEVRALKESGNGVSAWLLLWVVATVELKIHDGHCSPCFNHRHALAHSYQHGMDAQ